MTLTMAVHDCLYSQNTFLKLHYASNRPGGKMRWMWLPVGDSFEPRDEGSSLIKDEKFIN